MIRHIRHGMPDVAYADKTRQRRISAECRIVTRHLSFSGDVCLDHDRRDDHEELSYGGAAVAAVRVGASDCLAIHNVVSTSRGRASDLHPSNSHDYHDRLSVILLTGLT